MLRALTDLYEAGVGHGEREVKLAVRQARTFAEVPPRLDEQTQKLVALLRQLGAKVEDAAHSQNAELMVGDIAQLVAIQRVAQLPGALNVASQLVSGAMYAGIGSVLDANAGLFTSWLYSAVMDNATCSPCAALDGQQFESWDAIQEVLPDGGPNPDCDGEGRCRCRAVPGDAQTEVPAGTPPELAPPEDPLAGVVPEQDFARVVEEKQLNRHEFYAAAHGFRGPDAVASYRQAVDSELLRLTANAEIRIRVDATGLNGILDAGRWKSQFETQRSGGTLDNRLRASAEQKFFGYPRDLPVEQRPIYGYLEGADEHGYITAYGDIMVRIKNDVRSRSTVSMEDSLGSEFTFEHIPTPLTNPDYRSVMRTTDALAAPTQGTGPFAAVAPATYPEVQIHGGVSVSDIEEVVFDPSNAALYADLQQRLTDAGIRWRVAHF